MRTSIGNIMILQFFSIILFSIGFFKKKKNNLSTHNEWIRCLFYMYIAGLLSITILPIMISPNQMMRTELSFYTNFKPFKEVIHSFSTIGDAYSGDVLFHIKLLAKNLLGNIVILIPFGMFASIYKKKNHKAIKILISGFFITLTIETFQLLLSYTGHGRRIFDVDDLILNTVGYLIGYYLMQILSASKLFKLLHKKKSIKLIEQQTVNREKLS